MVDTAGVIGQWKEHFEELLNLTNMLSMVEAELEADEGSLSISLGEVTEVVKQVHRGKAPGIDEIRPEMLKAIGVEGLFWMTRFFNIAWDLGTVPKKWQNGVVVPTKKGDLRSVCQLLGYQTSQPPW